VYLGVDVVCGTAHHVMTRAIPPDPESKWPALVGAEDDQRTSHVGWQSAASLRHLRYDRDETMQAASYRCDDPQCLPLRPPTHWTANDWSELRIDPRRPNRTRAGHEDMRPIANPVLKPNARWR
jgi:hypothetical protein